MSFNQVTNAHAGLLKQKDEFADKRSSIPIGLLWYSNVAVVPLFCVNNIASRLEIM